VSARRAFDAGAFGVKWAKRVAFVALSIAVAFLATEAIVRVLFPRAAPRTARATKFWRYDPRYGWSHVPGTRGSFESFGFEAEVSINSKGFRGPEREYERGERPFRVLVLGDSFVWGYGVDFEDSFCARLERLIPELEVVNLAVNGYGTDQELLLYRDEGRKYDVDLVAVVVADNDFKTNVETVEFAIYGKPAFVIGEDGLDVVNLPVPQTPWLKRGAVRLAWNSYVLTTLHRFLELSRALDDVAHVPDPASDFPRSPSQAITMRLLEDLARDTTADGRDLIVIFADGVPAAAEAAKRLATRGIASVVLDDHLDHDDAGLHLPRDFHWNVEGHERVAAVLEGTLRSRMRPNGVAPDRGASDVR